MDPEVIMLGAGLAIDQVRPLGIQAGLDIRRVLRRRQSHKAGKLAGRQRKCLLRAQEQQRLPVRQCLDLMQQR